MWPEGVYLYEIKVILVAKTIYFLDVISSGAVESILTMEVSASTHYKSYWIIIWRVNNALVVRHFVDIRRQWTVPPTVNLDH